MLVVEKRCKGREKEIVIIKIIVNGARRRISAVKKRIVQED